MLWRSIPFVLGKSVAWKLPVQVEHRAVPSDFGQHTGGGNRIAARISLDQGRLRRREPANLQAVD